MDDYRVSLDVYNGPLDLLLYLIRRDEVDIYDIPISRVTEQYIQYVEVLQEVDPNLAGEFLVLAAALMEIKTRMLLPSPPPEEAAQQGLGGLDPRTELVRQLLEYKAFKDAAGDLHEAAVLQAMKYPRRPPVPTDAAGEVDLADVQVWDLLEAFSKLMASIGKQARQHEVIYDDTPVELHARDIVDRLQREGPMLFEKIFEGRTSRGEVVGLFLALLELVRQKRIFAMQEANFGTIQVMLNPEPPAEESTDHVASFAGDQQVQPEQAAPAGADAVPAGQYVSDPLDDAQWDAENSKANDDEEDSDDTGREDQVSGT